MLQPFFSFWLFDDLLLSDFFLPKQVLEQRPGPDFIVFSNHYFRGYPSRQNVNDSNSSCQQLSIFYSKMIDSALPKWYDIKIQNA